MDCRVISTFTRVFRRAMPGNDGDTSGHLEKLLSPPIADSPRVNVHESEREQSGISRRQFCGVRRLAAIFRGALVAVMQSGATVETATIGRGGVIGASAALGARWTFGRAVVQLPGAAAWLSAAQFHAAANECPAIRDLVVRYNDLLLAQVQQSVACNALHALEARLCRWLLQTHD